MKLLKTCLLLFMAVNLVEAQNCKAYIPYEEGTKLEMTNYDKKGKVTGIVNQELTEVKEAGNSTTFSMKQIITDENGKDPIETEMTFKCEDNVFYIDMNGFISEQQLEAYEDMEMEVIMDEIDIPADLTPGQKLKDGVITMKISSDSPMALNFSVEVINRKVEGFEKITTPAGTFDCVKLTQDIVTHVGIAITMSSIDWYAEGIGSVKNETYRRDKLMGYSELTKIEKP